jgi:hypothetical protein
MKRLILCAVAALLCSATAAWPSVEISTAPTSNMVCSSGVCAPSAETAVLNANDLATMLATADVKVVTGSGAVTITVAASFSWTSASRLTLDAAQNVSFAAPVTVAGPGGLSIVYNDGGANGDLTFVPGAKADFWDSGSSLTINGDSYLLVGSVATLAADVEHTSSGHYALAADYDASADTSWPIPVFTGTFEGLGHQISNMTLSDASSGLKKRSYPNFGLFAVAYDAFIRDLSLVHVVFEQYSPKHSYYGALAGSFSGDINHVSADVDFAMEGGSCSAGGLVGDNRSGIENSFTTGSINGCRGVGGLAVVNYGTITNSSSSVAVSGRGVSGVGGLVDVNFGSIIRSHATGAVSGTDVGGLVAQNACSFVIDQSYATGDVSGSDWVGGLIAYNAAIVSNSYATGAVRGGRLAVAGGLVGSANDDGNCFATSAISNSYSSAKVSGGGMLGGVIGKDNTSQQKSSDVYWDLNTSGIGNPSQGAGNIADDTGLTGLTNAQLKSGLPAGFDPSFWGRKRSINGGYPYLLANPPQ